MLFNSYMQIWWW